MPFFKYAGYTFGGLLLLGLALGTGLYLQGRNRAHQTIEVPPSVTSVSADSARPARGEHLSYTLGCRHCHGADLGGTVFTDAPPFRLTAPNLTRGDGGIGDGYTAADWARSIRHGVDPAGEPLIGMPSKNYHELGNRDLQAIIAYLQQMEPVDNPLPPTTVKTMGYLLIGAGEIDVTANVVHSTKHPTAVPVAATVEYGAYLYDTACKDCHRPHLQGGPHPDPAGPAVPSLQKASTWPYEAIKRAITKGTSIDGRRLNDKWMPWSAFSHMTDEEIRALYRFLQRRASNEGEPSSSQ